MMAVSIHSLGAGKLLGLVRKFMASTHICTRTGDQRQKYLHAAKAAFNFNPQQKGYKHV